jgi:hypothetical protein
LKLNSNSNLNLEEKKKENRKIKRKRIKSLPRPDCTISAHLPKPHLSPRRPNPRRSAPTPWARLSVSRACEVVADAWSRGHESPICSSPLLRGPVLSGSPQPNRGSPVDLPRELNVLPRLAPPIAAHLPGKHPTTRLQVSCRRDTSPFSTLSTPESSAATSVTVARVRRH